MNIARGIFLFCLVVPRLIYGATWHITDATDSGPNSLRSAITEANRIAETNLIYLDFSVPLRLASGLPPLAGNLAILGTLSAPPVLSLIDTNPVLRILSGSLALSNVAVSGCAISNAPCIWNRAKLAISRCLLSENTSYSSRDRLGGIIVSSGELLVESSRFVSNMTIGIPPGDWPSGQIGNPALGGGLQLWGGSCHVIGTAFTSNSSRGGAGLLQGDLAGLAAGGAIYAVSSTLSIEDSSFVQNATFGATPTGWAAGGALYLSNCVAALERCSFSGNSTQGSDAYLPGTLYYSPGGEAVGGGLYSDLSDLRIWDSSFSKNSALPGRDNAAPFGIARGGAIMNLIRPCYLSNCLFSANTAQTAADIAGPIHSGGFNSVERPGGAWGFQPADDIPFKGILTNNPRFEWIQLETNGSGSLALFGASDRQSYHAFSTKSGALGLASRDRFGRMEWTEQATEILQYTPRIVGSIVQSNLVSLIVGEQDPPYSLTRDSAGHYIRSAFSDETNKVFLEFVIQHDAYIYSAMTVASSSNRFLKAERRRGGDAFSIKIGAEASVSNGPFFRAWRGAAVDLAGNWYLSGSLGTDVQWNGQLVPADFLLKLTPLGDVAWVIPHPPSSKQYVGELPLYPIDNGLLVHSYPSGWTFVSGDGVVQWHKELLLSPFTLVDARHNLLYAVSVNPVAPFELATVPTDPNSSVHEYLIYSLTPRLDVNWAVRLTGPLSVQSCFLDVDSNIVFSGSFSDVVAFDNQAVFSTPTPTMFLAKLSTAPTAFPRIYASQLPNQLELFWPTNEVVLQHAPSLGPTSAWTILASSPAGPYYSRATVSATNRTGFFRLGPAE